MMENLYWYISYKSCFSIIFEKTDFVFSLEVKIWNKKQFILFLPDNLE